MSQAGTLTLKTPTVVSGCVLVSYLCKGITKQNILCLIHVWTWGKQVFFEKWMRSTGGWLMLVVCCLPSWVPGVQKHELCPKSLPRSFTVPCITDYAIASSKWRFWTLIKSSYSDGQTILFTLKHGYIFVWFGFFFFWKQSHRLSSCTQLSYNTSNFPKEV